MDENALALHMPAHRGEEMRLSDELLECYIALRHPGSTTEEIAKHAAAFRALVERGEQSFQDCFVAVSERGEATAALSLIRVQEGAFALSAPRSTTSGHVRDEILIGLLDEALRRARELGASKVGLRLEQVALSGELRAQLRALGFRPRRERAEFRADVARLPTDCGTPLEWDCLAPTGRVTLEEAAAILGRSCEGDPDWDPDDDPRALLEGFLAEPDMRCDSDCVQVATLDGRVAGIVVAQVSPSSGWSRITYMGLVPELRGRGLGSWLHRHGFGMMRAQGGLEYCGGTVTSNHGMIRLFERHGCTLDRKLEEWVFVAPAR